MFQCPSCDLKFSLLGKLKSHSYTHATEPGCPCSECHLVFWRPEQKIRHLREDHGIYSKNYMTRHKRHAAENRAAARATARKGELSDSDASKSSARATAPRREPPGSDASNSSTPATGGPTYSFMSINEVFRDAMREEAAKLSRGPYFQHDDSPVERLWLLEENAA